MENTGFLMTLNHPIPSKLPTGRFPGGEAIKQLTIVVQHLDRRILVVIAPGTPCDLETNE